MKQLAIGIIALMLTTTARAEIKTQDIKYKAGEQTMKGFLAWDDAITEKRPGVIVVPEWWGLTDYPKNRAKQLAELGYVALAIDMYGDGKATDDPKQAGEWAGGVKSDKAIEVARLEAAINQLKNHKSVDSEKIGAIGYCFGGTMVLELGRASAPIHAIVGFHAGLINQSPGDEANITGKVLECVGVNDPIVSASQRATFEDEMNAAGVDWQMLLHSGAGHSFTNRAMDGSRPGFVYHEASDRRSWQAMINLFDEVFGAHQT